MFKIMKIKEKVLFVVIFVSMISLLAMTIPSYFTIRRISDYSEKANRELGAKAVTGIGDALYVQAHDFLSTIASERSNAADIVLQNIEFNVELLSGAVHDAFINSQNYVGHRLMHASEAEEGIDSSTWMLSTRYELTNEIKREIELLSNLDMIMPVLKSDPNVLQLYVGTNNGLAYTYSSVLLNNPEFDPRERPWYIEALKHPNEVVFTDVYESAFDAGMVLTAAKAIYGDDGGLIGVAGLDMKLEDLKNYMLNTHVADTGYVFIMDNNGNYIIHPDMGENHFYHFRDGEDVLFADGLRNMMNGEQGFIRENVDGHIVYLAFSPMSTINWSVGAVAPEDEILSAKNILSEQMQSITNQAVSNIQFLRENTVWIFVVIFMLCIFMITIIGMYLTRLISRPIDQLAKDVSNFGGGDFEYRAHVDTDDEIGYLAKIFNQMADNIVKSMDELTSVATVRERLNSELRIAAKIQSEMLPDLSSVFANHPFVNVFGLVEPALEMGGDLYDVFFVDKEESKLCAVIADVSGKGIPSAMFMVKAKTLIRNFMLAGETTSDALRKTNNRLCEGNRSNMFITVYISLTDFNTGEYQYSQAGHNPVVYCPHGKYFRFIRTDQTMPLGFLPDNQYPLYRVNLSSGDKFFYYTDGVTEALNENDTQWGEDALLTVLNSCNKCSCSEIAAYVRDMVAKHAGDAEQSDDITILVLEFGFGAKI